MENDPDPNPYLSKNKTFLEGLAIAEAHLGLTGLSEENPTTAYEVTNLDVGGDGKKKLYRSAVEAWANAPSAARITEVPLSVFDEEYNALFRRKTWPKAGESFTEADQARWDELNHVKGSEKCVRLSEKMQETARRIRDERT